jgi:hypothetical protein
VGQRFQAEACKGGWIELEQMDSAGSPLLSLGLGEPPAWLYYTPLPPLFLLMFTGLYMFVLPYAAAWRRKREQS